MAPTREQRLRFDSGEEAAGAVDAQGVAVFDGGHTIADGHDRGNLHFARRDCPVRERAAGFGDDGDSVVEERGPSGVGGASHEDRAFGEGGKIVDGADQVGGTDGLARAAGKSGKNGGGGAAGSGGSSGVAGGFIDRTLAGVLVFTMSGERIQAVHIIGDPRKLSFLSSQLA